MNEDILPTVFIIKSSPVVSCGVENYLRMPPTFTAGQTFVVVVDRMRNRIG